jgi:UDP-glucose 4-epimerase
VANKYLVTGGGGFIGIHLVDATLLAAESAAAEGSVLNIACGQSTSVFDLVAAITEASGRELGLRFEPPRLGDVLHSCANIDLARERLGCEPTVSVSQGIGLTYESMVRADG